MSWFTFSWTPVRDAAGAIAGFYCAATETSEKVDIEEAGRRESAAALRESELRYRTLFESIDEGFYLARAMFDEAGRCTDILYMDENPAAVRMTGRSAKGRRLSELGDYEDYWREIFGAVARTGEARRLEQFAQPDGVWYDFYVFRPRQARLDEFAVIFRDVTDRKRSEQALRTSEERLRSALEIDTVGVLFWGPDFRLKEANPAFLATTGFSREEALGLTWQELTPPEFHEVSEQAVAQIEATGWAEPYEKQYYRKDGSRWWALFAPRRLSDGEVVEFVLDVSDRMEKGQALAASEERLRLIVENARDYAIFTTDTEGRIEQWYAGAAAVFGWSAEEARGQQVEITFTPEDRAKGAPREERETAAGEGRAANVRWHVRKGGALVFIEGIATPLKGADGRLQGFLKIGQDVTDRKRAEEHQKMLLAELQHRVRNTLGVIRSIARRTAATSDDVEQMSMHLEGRIGAFSRVQAVVTRNPEAGIDLAAMIEDELLAHAAREGEALVIDGPDVCLKPRPAETISLAIHELATNAVKYGALSAEGGRIAVRWERARPDGLELLKLVWEENGVEGTPSEPRRQGFGLELLQRTLPYELAAETQVEFRPEGLRFSMAVPLGPTVLAE